MYTTENYFYGWLLYSLGGIVFMGCWWYLTAKSNALEIRALLRTIAAVTIFTPWYADPDMGYLAPAVVIAGTEGLFDSDFWRAGIPLLAALAVGIAASLVYCIVSRVSQRKAEAAT